MTKIKRFEDLVAWQKTRDLAKVIYRVTRQGGFAKDFGFNADSTCNWFNYVEYRRRIRAKPCG